VDSDRWEAAGFRTLLDTIDITDTVVTAVPCTPNAPTTSAGAGALPVHRHGIGSSRNSTHAIPSSTRPGSAYDRCRHAAWAA
jgi:hypothetical protein